MKAPSGVTAKPLANKLVIPGMVKEPSGEKLAAVRSKLKACTTPCVPSYAYKRFPTTRKVPRERGCKPVGGVPVIVVTSAGLIGLVPTSKTSRLPGLDTRIKDLLSCVISM